MSPYRVELRPAAVRVLRQLDFTAASRVRGAIALLAIEPRPPSARALSGRPGYRVRVGECRIIYASDDGVLVIVVVMVGRRREVYDR